VFVVAFCEGAEEVVTDELLLGEDRMGSEGADPFREGEGMDSTA
jgi:hypothetical protein